MAVLTSGLFGGISLLAGLLNLLFLFRASRRYSALLETENTDSDLRRIGSGFILIWACVIFNDMIRFVVGIGVLLSAPHSLYLLMLTPLTSVLIAVIGLRSFFR